jgi:hypothetical protein
MEAVPQVAAALGIRLVARVIDFVLLGLAGAALGHAMGFGFGWLALTAAATYVYFVAADVLFGCTLGKAALRLRVRGEPGGLPSWKAGCRREAFVVLGAVPFVGPVLALAAWITIAITVRRSPVGEGWHDRLAGGTRIVRA